MESLDKDNLRTLLHIFWVQIDREKGLNNEMMSVDPVTVMSERISSCCVVLPQTGSLSQPVKVHIRKLTGRIISGKRRRRSV